MPVVRLPLLAPAPPVLRQTYSLPKPSERTSFARVHLRPSEKTIASPKKRPREVTEVFARRRREAPSREHASSSNSTVEIETCLTDGYNGTDPVPVDASNDWGAPIDGGDVTFDASQASGGEGLGGEMHEMPFPDGNTVLSEADVGAGGSVRRAYTDADDFDMSFAAYVDTMAARSVSIIQICETLFVAQGWNARYNSGTVRPHRLGMFLLTTI